MGIGLIELSGTPFTIPSPQPNYPICRVHLKTRLVLVGLSVGGLMGQMFRASRLKIRGTSKIHIGMRITKKTIFLDMSDA